MVHPLWRHKEQENYNGPKVNNVALVKSGHMLETLSIPHYSLFTWIGSVRLLVYNSDNMTGADNQQERPDLNQAFGILRDYTPDFQASAWMKI